MTDPAFVSIPWVHSNLEAPGITVIDGSWHMPATGRDARVEFAERALPGAVFFDIEQVADTSADLPHTCPTPEQFAQAMSAMGVRNTDFIVIYDTQGLFTAARVWWLFRLFGHARVAIMEGGLPAWEAAELPILNFRRLPLMPICLPPTKTFVVLPHRRRPLFLTRDLRVVFQVRNPNQGPAFLVAICPVQ